jgi:hypothetical protein
MITDVASYPRFFDSVQRRTARDVATLPPEASAWRPPAVRGEVGLPIGQIVGHIGTSRLYFASAYRQEGWVAGAAELDPTISAPGFPGSPNRPPASSRCYGILPMSGCPDASR